MRLSDIHVRLYLSVDTPIPFILILEWHTDHDYHVTYQVIAL